MYSVRRKQQMLKIRLMGTKSDIRWFQNFLQIDSDIEVLELSDIYPNKGTDRYYRSYAEVERKDGNAGRPTENGKSNRKKQIKAPVPPIKAKYPIMAWKNLPFNTAVWKESEKLAGKEGYKHPVRVVYNPKTMTYRTILNKSKFQVIDKKDLEFYKEAEKTDKSIKVCEVNEEDFLYLNFDTNPKPTEEELMQMLEKARKEMSGLEKEKYNSEVQLTEDSQFNENIVNVPNFGTQKEEWDLSGTIEQCIIIRYASKLDGNQMNEILLGLEEGLTDEQVKSYFKLPADQMKQQRLAIISIEQ